MLLADFRMPSMTGSEAVDKYIYVSERPPNNIFIFQFFSQLINHLNLVFSMRPLSFLQRKPDIYMIYDGHSPYASYETSLLITPETFTAVPNRQPTHSSCLYLCADISAGDLVILGVWKSALSPQKSNCLSVSEFWLLG